MYLACNLLFDLPNFDKALQTPILTILDIKKIVKKIEKF